MVRANKLLSVRRRLFIIITLISLQFFWDLILEIISPWGLLKITFLSKIFIPLVVGTDDDFPPSWDFRGTRLLDIGLTTADVVVLLLQVVLDEDEDGGGSGGCESCFCWAEVGGWDACCNLNFSALWDLHFMILPWFSG